MSRRVNVAPLLVFINSIKKARMIVNPRPSSVSPRGPQVIYRRGDPWGQLDGRP